MFRNAKVGDRAYDILRGWGTIVAIKQDSEYPICFKADIDSFCTFTFDGKRADIDISPSLFWDEIKFDMPFSLENELKKLKRKKYVFNENNVHFVWNNKIDTLEFFANSICETFHMVYFEQNEDFMNFIKKVKENKITREQFFKAYSNVFGGGND